jgi:hypothetical protein
MADPKIIIPTRLTVSTGKKTKPILLMQAHRMSPRERVVAWLKAVRHDYD